jgi:pimeloyl-ACP methyl ester carboxylesterase
MAKIIGWPGTAGRFEGPALFLSGAESPYVKPEHRETIRALFPAARFARLAGAGHWLHAEKPREFEETVRVFLG